MRRTEAFQVQLLLFLLTAMERLTIHGSVDWILSDGVGLQQSLVILCSSLVQGSRNPMWGEEFDFYTEDLPVEVRCSESTFVLSYRVTS